MISTMYWDTCVQVTAFMPPRNEQTSTPVNPRNMPTVKSTPVSQVVIRPMP
jgi:hypothetical protein